MRVMTEAHKQAIKEGRAKAKLERMKNPIAKPDKKVDKSLPLSKQEFILEVDGKERTAFDFFPAIKASMRRRHYYTLYPLILKEITSSVFWKNPEVILEKLQKYFTIQKVAKKKNYFKAKKERKSKKET